MLFYFFCLLGKATLITGSEIESACMWPDLLLASEACGWHNNSLGVKRKKCDVLTLNLSLAIHLS